MTEYFEDYVVRRRAHDSRAEVLHRHIGAGNQLAELPQIVRVPKIGSIAFFVAIDRLKKRVLALRITAADVKVPPQIPRSGPLDFDDPRSQIGKPERA